MRERRRTYELMYIVSPLRSAEDEIAGVIDRVRGSIASAGGEVTSTNHAPPWGRRKFAYPIREYAEGEASRRSFSEGYYVLCHLTLPTSQVPTLERALGLNDSVLRYLLTLVDSTGAAPAVADEAAAVAVPAGATEDEASEVEEDGEGEEDEA